MSRGTAPVVDESRFEIIRIEATANAWYYFALFAAVIVGLILEPIPAAAVGLIGVTTATVSLLVVPKPADAIK